jgi:Barstar (barnase inhibitor)
MTRLDLSVGEELSRSFEPCLRHLSKKVALRANMLLEGRLTMAVFDVSNPEQFNQLDWKMLQHGAVSLYNDHTVLTEDCTWFGERHYHVHQFDCASWQNIADFYTAINQELDWPFPCSNLDALEELLVDMHVPQESGTLFVFWRFDPFARRFSRHAHQVLDIMEQTSRRFLLSGQRFMVLVHSDDPDLAFDPVGARPVSLNPTERLRKMLPAH